MSQVTIVSLAPYSPFGVHRTEGDYVMPAKKKDEPYAKLVVKDGRTFKDFGEKQKVWETVAAREIAEDLTRDCSEHGVFIAAGDEPTDEELRAAAKKLRQEFYPRLIEEADSSYARTGDRKDISLHARVAARILNLKRDWALDLSELTPCIGCQELVAESVVKCKNCGAILNWEKARALGLVSPEQYRFATQEGIEVKRGPGRPSNASKLMEANG